MLGSRIVPAIRQTSAQGTDPRVEERGYVYSTRTIRDTHCASNVKQAAKSQRLGLSGLGRAAKTVWIRRLRFA